MKRSRTAGAATPTRRRVRNWSSSALPAARHSARIELLTESSIRSLRRVLRVRRFKLVSQRLVFRLRGSKSREVLPRLARVYWHHTCVHLMPQRSITRPLLSEIFSITVADTGEWCGFPTGQCGGCEEFSMTLPIIHPGLLCSPWKTGRMIRTRDHCRPLKVHQKNLEKYGPLQSKTWEGHRLVHFNEDAV